jgi:tetratricopeptide (TPR) repeat protein
MKKTSEPEFRPPEDTVPSTGQGPRSDASAYELRQDPDYQKLLEIYQDGSLSLSDMVVHKLLRRYPDNPELLRIRDEIEMRFSVKDMGKTFKKQEKRSNRKSFLNLAIFAILGSVIVVLVFYFSFIYLARDVAVDQYAQDQAQLASLERQVEQLLVIGNPQPAADIVARMVEIDPNYESLPDLSARVETLLALEADYQAALGLADEGNAEEALAIFRGIEEENPGLWDVGQQIADLEAFINNKDIRTGEEAFRLKDWDGVISAYESAFTADPGLSDPQVKEQLLIAYLSKINNDLEMDAVSLGDLETAEETYRKGMALLPENGRMSSQTSNLKKKADGLFGQGYASLAAEKLASPGQTLDDIDEAIAYFTMASAFDAKSQALQSQLAQAETYKLGFEQFNAMDWEAAITSLEAVAAEEVQLTGDNVNILLYEAYYALGKGQLSEDLYEEAIETLAKAESLALEDSENLMKLFQTQVLIGDTLVEAREYEDAVTYYQDALEGIQFTERAAENTALIGTYEDAIAQVGRARYDRAAVDYREVLDGINAIYSASLVEISEGVCLALFASENLSTLEAVTTANDLPEALVVDMDQTLLVPSFEN